MQLDYDTLVFDLDGTIIDSSPGIFSSLRPAFAALGLSDPPESLLRRFIGPPLTESFHEFCDLDGETLALGIKTYREHYSARGKYECAVYLGLPRLFARWRGEGKRLFVATSKPEEFARDILGHLGLLECFDGVYGADFSERFEKWQVLSSLIEENEGVDRAHAIMIGDRKYDVKGAQRCELDCVGVLYGFGERDELESAGAIAIAETVESLGDLFL